MAPLCKINCIYIFKNVCVYKIKSWVSCQKICFQIISVPPTLLSLFRQGPYTKKVETNLCKLRIENEIFIYITFINKIRLFKILSFTWKIVIIVNVAQSDATLIPILLRIKLLGDKTKIVKNIHVTHKYYYNFYNYVC